MSVRAPDYLAAATFTGVALMRARIAVLALSLLPVQSCFIVHGVSVTPLERAPAAVETPVRVHLVDGTTAVFPAGVEITRTEVVGTGMSFSVTLRDSQPVQRLPLSQVLGMEAYDRPVDAAATLGVSTLATVVVIAGSVAIYCASNPKCFGSCPTVYADSDGTEVLEAEGFSYSIAPLFEMRDVDALRVREDSAGRVRLEVRNEALETHYINQLALLDVRHEAGETAVPDPRGLALALRGLRTPARITDRAGRDVRGVLADHDGIAYATDSSVLARATGADHDDWIDVEVPAPHADSAALFLRLRNSLLTTVLFYDVMIGDRGPHAPDYLMRDLNRLGPAVDLGRWYASTLGMHVAVWRDSAWQPVTRFLDTGPVAWKDLGVLVPVPRGATTLRVRFSFVADDWRIDRIAVADAWRRPEARVLPLARVIDSDGHADTTALASLRDADGRYLQTQGGQRFTAWFDAGQPPQGSTRTFFLVSQGYYIEWVRQGWLRRPPAANAFIPGDSAIATALGRWRADHESIERQFAATRVPVR